MSDKPKVTSGDITDELYREYDIPGRPEPYRINAPVKLFTRPGGTTHRVLDREGVIHCISFPGNGTVLRWKPREGKDPVAF
ncbi:MAG: hypothetical protein ACYS7Y_03900 [Planctomycetota bacterium]|jgi:hypothetical protein